MIDEKATLADVCFAVAGALEACGISAVLTGGSAAAMYAPAEYMSEDADFILDADDPLDDVAAALRPIGFERHGKSRIFTHPRSRFTVDYPKGPLAVGGEYVHETARIRRGPQQLRLLTRIDSIRDRLAHFYFWDDYTALNAAVAVGKGLSGDDLERIRAWTEREEPALLEKFAEFERRVSTPIRPEQKRRRAR